MTLTITDMFCGAGGSSTGAIQVPGVEVRTAMNHWDLAIETHNTNHPQTDHVLADISQTDPRYVRGSDILWASPECTNHSKAKGKKKYSQPDLFGETITEDAVRRSRATMWDVVRFSEHHRYQAVIVENVIDIADWGDDDTCRGGLFDAWLYAMKALGYDFRIMSLNSMHAQLGGLPAPQSRDRVYIVFWRKGIPAPDLERVVRPQAWCPSCEQVVDAMQTFKRPGSNRPGCYRAQYVYRCPKHSCRGQIVEPAWLPASSIIDWTNLGRRIGERTRPLAAKTMARIKAGIDRYWAPLLVEAAGNTYDSADPKCPTFGKPGGYYRAWPTSEPVRTVHTSSSKALAVHPLLVPVEGRDGKNATSAALPARTMTSRNETGCLLPPFIAELRGGGSKARPADDPLATVCAGGNHHALVMSYYGKSAMPVPDSRPLPTVTTVDRCALVMRNNTQRGNQASMSTPASEPTRTITTTGHQSLLSAQTPTIDAEDVFFRMLEPSEIKKAMSFPDEYTLLGSKRDQVRMAGNAVTPPAARDLVAVVAESILGEAA
ncbi:MAG: DNA cytosine methyltransferase [Propionibacteriaceae bacterium]|jgi:DNA (cytosine-5)-methyltransferase 1|nr:DNA cytosine methyltransferase [Propionibacteriaceae bacterium]